MTGARCILRIPDHARASRAQIAYQTDQLNLSRRDSRARAMLPRPAVFHNRASARTGTEIQATLKQRPSQAAQLTPATNPGPTILTV